MAVITIGRMAEEIKKMLDGGDSPLAANITYNEIKIAIGQVANQLLKIDYFSINGKMAETIPNGSVLGLYENVSCEIWNGRTQFTLPIKPIKLPRNMGVWAVYPKYKTNENYQLDKELIPLQMGQGGLIKSQPMINDLMGQTGYEMFGDKGILTKNLKSIFPDLVLALRLVIMDISEYGDYDILPIMPEMEWDIKKEIVKMYSGEAIPDKIVDSAVKASKNIPVTQQRQS